MKRVQQVLFPSFGSHTRLLLGFQRAQQHESQKNGALRMRGTVIHVEIWHLLEKTRPSTKTSWHFVSGFLGQDFTGLPINATSDYGWPERLMSRATRLRLKPSPSLHL